LPRFLQQAAFTVSATGPRVSEVVGVERPCGAGTRDGGGVLRTAASPAATRNTNGGRPCCGQVASTVIGRSANRPPASLSAPKLPLRQNTAGRNARSDTLFVGSTHSTRAKVHSAAYQLVSSRHSVAALWSGLACPRRSSRPSHAWSGTNRRCNSGRSHSPARKRYHRRKAPRCPGWPPRWRPVGRAVGRRGASGGSEVGKLPAPPADGGC